MTLWRQRNADYHGVQGAHTLEKRRKETAARAKEVYHETLGNIPQSDGLILHRAKISEILNWTKQHLDAYLATAKVVCDWLIEPG
jgi:3'-phosphoadenosine 5'-phosphosulfate sulfotransferase (PAPS reductase)/FAD synthetase